MSYIALATTTLGSSATSVTFSSIPATVNGVALRDLIVVINGTSSSTQGGRMVLNSDTSSSYSTVRMYGVGSGSGASDSFGGTFGYIGDMFSSPVTQIRIQIMDALATDKHKTFLYRMDNASNYTMAGASRYASNTAISSVALSLNNAASYAIGTTISLYGVA